MLTEVGPREAREGVGGEGMTCLDLVAAIGTGIGRETGTEAGRETGKGTGIGIGIGIGREREVQTRIGSSAGTMISTPTGIAMEQGTETGRETQMVQGAAGNEIVRGIEPPSPLDWAMKPKEKAAAAHLHCAYQFVVLSKTRWACATTSTVARAKYRSCEVGR
jgi:hypothetical protein